MIREVRRWVCQPFCDILISISEQFPPCGRIPDFAGSKETAGRLTEREVRDEREVRETTTTESHSYGLLCVSTGSTARLRAGVCKTVSVGLRHCAISHWPWIVWCDRT